MKKQGLDGRKKIIIRVALGLVIAGAALGVALTGVALWLGRDLPDPASIAQELNIPSVRITDRNGRLLYDALPSEGGRHTIVALADIPLALQQATIATEDSRFYQNPGVDLVGIVRAAWINLTGGETLSGGSTITQQVARKLLMSEVEQRDRSLRRKLREAILAWNLARLLPKDQILALYLNQMYYGNLAYGVEAASQTYFGKPASELDLAESALLAGLPQAPSAYDPFNQPEAAKRRQKVVLELMVKSGAVDAGQASLAEGEPLVYNSRPYPIQAPHFVLMVRQEVEKLVSQEEVYRLGGLTVRTTLDLDWQQQAEQAVRHQLDQLQKEGEKAVSYNVNDAALVAMDPQSGDILAMVGSADYFDAQISGAVNIALAPRQPGSALKPLIYAAAMDPAQPNPWTAATMLLDVSTNFTTHDGKAYTPVNYDEQEHGPVLARQALASSLNIPAVLTLQHVGLERLFTLAGGLGITTLGDPNDYDLSLALGGGEVTLTELTAAYGALANGGLKTTPIDILDIRDPHGNVVYTPDQPERSRVIDERVAWLISDILSDDAARETGFGRNSVLNIGRPAAVKTGTTTNFHDNWTVGYTPGLVVGVWAGNADYKAMRKINGLTGAAPIWAEFMRSALTGQPEHSFSRPPGLSQVEICALSGLLPSPDCPYQRKEWFIDGTQPTRTDTVYHRVTLDQATGLLADENTPPERRMPRLALDLPAQAIPWAAANDQMLYSQVSAAPVAQYSGGTSQMPGLEILSPANLSVYHLAANLDPGAQRLLVSVAAGADVNSVTLAVDGLPVAVLPGPQFKFWWQLTPGKHTFQVRSDAQVGGKLASEIVTIEVK